MKNVTYAGTRQHHGTGALVAPQERFFLDNISVGYNSTDKRKISDKLLIAKENH